MIVEYRRRAYDGKLSVLKYEPAEDIASAWVCISVVDDVKTALARMKEAREIDVRRITLDRAGANGGSETRDPEELIRTGA